MRALVKEILARRMPRRRRTTPPCRRAGSTRRCSSPMSAMSPENLEGGRPRGEDCARARPLSRLCPAAGRQAPRFPHEESGKSLPPAEPAPDGVWKAGRRWWRSAGPIVQVCRRRSRGPHPVRRLRRHLPWRSRGRAGAPRRAIRPEMAPQALEKTESAPDKSGLPHAFEARRRGDASPRALAPRGANVALPPAAEPPQCDPRPRSPAPARKWRWKWLKTLVLRPEPTGHGRGRAKRGAASARRRLCARRRFAGGSPTAGEPDRTPSRTTGRISTTVVLTPDPAAPGGFRRMRIRHSPQWRGGLCRRGLSQEWPVGNPAPPTRRSAPGRRGSISGTAGQ